MGLRRRGPIAALAALVVTAVAIASSCADGPDGERVPPASPPPRPREPGGGTTPPSMRPNEVVPEPAVDLRPLPWTRVEATDGGRRLRVYATITGRPPCAVLGRLDLQQTSDAVTVTLWVGRRPDADCGGPQPAIGFPIVVAVDLDAPLEGREIRDGAS